MFAHLKTMILCPAEQGPQRDLPGGPGGGPQQETRLCRPWSQGCSLYTECLKILAQSAVLTYINSIVFLCNR